MTLSSEKSKVRTYLFYLSFFCVGSAVLTFAWQKLPVAEIPTSLSKFSFKTITLALLITFSQVILLATRLWWLLPRNSETFAKVSPIKALRAFSNGQVINAVFPARAGDLMKASQLGMGNDKKGAFATAAGTVFIADKVLDVGALFLMGSLLFPDLISKISIPEFPKWLAPAGVLSLIAGAASLWIWKLPLLTAMKSKFHFIKTGASGLFSPPRLVVGLVLSIAAWLAEATTLAMLCRDLDVHLNVTQSLWTLTAINIGIAVPLSVANLGTFEASAIAALVFFLVPLPAAVAIAFTHHLVQIAGVTGMAAVSHLFFSRATSKTPHSHCL